MSKFIHLLASLRARGLVGRALIGLLLAIGCSGGPSESFAQGGLNFTTYEVPDPNFGGIRVASISIPAGWRTSSQVQSNIRH